MNLDSWLETEHSDAERLQLSASLCAAVEAAHKSGAVRLGLDPSGIEVEAGARCRLGTDPPHTISPYAPPEVARGGEHTARSDVYTAGLICYAALARQATPEAHPRPPLGALRPDLPPDLADALNACVEQDPEWRPADLSFVLSLLEPFAAPKPTPAARPVAAPKSPVAPRPPATRAATPPRVILQAPARQDSRLPRVLIGVLGAAVAVAGAAWVWLNVVRPSAGREAGPAASLLPTTSTAPPGDVQVAAAIGTPASPALAASPDGSDEGAVSAPPPTPAAPASAPTAAQPSPSPSAPSAPTTLPEPRPQPTARIAATDAETGPPADPPRVRPTPAAANPAAPDGPVTTPPGNVPASAGPATISAISPFQLRPGALQAVDVRGEGLTAAHVAYVTTLRKRERVEGITATRHQLREPGLLLVFLRLDAVRPGRYALSVVGPDGSESNAYPIEVVRK